MTKLPEREGNALQGVSRWFWKIQRILSFHIERYQPHSEKFISEQEKAKTLKSHDCKRRVSSDRCHAVTPYKFVALPEKLPQGQFYYG